MFSKSLALCALLTACGIDPNAGQTEPNATSSSQVGEKKDGIQYQPTAPAEKEVTVEYRKEGQTYALAVDDTKDMPACVRENNRQLVYVKSQDKFFACEDNWLEVDLRGEAGAAGAAGKDGEAGASVVGPKGEKGDQGEPGEDGEPVSPNQWFDPISGHTWLVGGQQTEAMTNAYVSCEGDWRLPTVMEARDAVHRGLALASSLLGASSPTKFWTSSFSTTACAAGVESCRAAVDANGSERYGSLATGAGVACLKGDAP